MTVLDRIPALKGHGRHRAVDRVDELAAENRTLFTRLMAADDAFAILRHDLADAHARQAEAEEIVVQQLADIDELTAERDGLAEELAALKRRFAAQLAAQANAHAITVRPAIRPIDGPEDQATAPIDVRPLWVALGVRPVTDPGHVHTR